jgi:DNA topoisomerase IB
MAAALLLCGLSHPGSERACKRCIKEVLEQVADRLGHTVAICRSSYVHPRLLEDFSANRLSLAPFVRRRARTQTLGLENLRAIERTVARYLAPRKRRRA